MIARRLPLATGLAYNVQTWDGPGDTTFCLVHGFTDLGAGWLAVAPLLAAHGHVIAPDLRGHGDSDRVGAGGYYHFFDYVADLDDVIRQMARERLVLVGHSMGGSVCGYFAGARPARVGALVLIEGLGPPDLMGGEGPSRTAMWMDTWRGVRPSFKPITLDEAVRRLRKNDHLLDEPLARQLAEAGTRPAPGTDGLVVWKHDPLHNTIGPYPYRLETARRHWEKIACPTLIVDGAESRLNLPEAERASRRASFANHRHVVVEGAGHSPQRHQPQRLAELILQHAGFPG